MCSPRLRRINGAGEQHAEDPAAVEPSAEYVAVTRLEIGTDRVSPTVSIVIPAHNAEDTIGRAVGSAVAQVGVDREVIVVDDGSSDRTAEVLADFLSTVAVRVIFHETNRGGSAARNTGAAHAAGSWLAFLDADDEWEPERLLHAFGEVQASGCEFAIGSFEWSRPESEGDWRCTPRLPPDVTDADLLSAPPLGAGSTLIVRASLFRDVGGFDTTMPRHQDWDLVIRLSERTRGHVVSDPLVRVHRTGRPAYRAVVLAKRQFLRKHASAIDRLTVSERRRVRAEHELDLARYASYERMWSRMVGRLGRVLWWWPPCLIRWAAARGGGRRVRRRATRTSP